MTDSVSTDPNRRTGAHDYVTEVSSRLSSHWGLVLAFGILTAALGIVLAVWPGRSLVVFAIVFAIQLLATGVYRIIEALVGTDADTSARVLSGLSGALAALAGLLFLRAPLQTLAVLGILLGGWWVVSGVLDIVRALTGTPQGSRWWKLGMGVLSVLAGAYLVVNPGLSLLVMISVACVWLVGYGALAIIAAFQLRSQDNKQGTGDSSGSAYPANGS
jgi:uncharacterized membrane protein HdeD (DUF308 family)